MSDKRPLEVVCLTKDFGGTRALHEVSFVVEGPSIVAVVGSNGAGKSTLVDVLSGFETPTAGSASLGGRLLTGLSAEEVVGRGVARTFQSLRLAGTASVCENVLVAAEAASRRVRATGAFRTQDDANSVVQSVLERLRLLDHAGAAVSTLSFGLRKMTCLACALATGGSVLLLDEPFGGLSQARIDDTCEVLRAFRRDGGTIILIEHNLHALKTVADRVILLSKGHLALDGTSEDVLTRPDFVETFLK